MCKNILIFLGDFQKLKQQIYKLSIFYLIGKYVLLIYLFE